MPNSCCICLNTQLVRWCVTSVGALAPLPQRPLVIPATQHQVTMTTKYQTRKLTSHTQATYHSVLVMSRFATLLQFLLVVSVCVIIFFFGNLVGSDWITNSKNIIYKQDPNLLDGCQHVYLDMGTNTGIQIRKLYQPHLFPNASIIKVFDKYFGLIDSR